MTPTYNNNNRRQSYDNHYHNHYNCSNNNRHPSHGHNETAANNNNNNNNTYDVSRIRKSHNPYVIAVMFLLHIPSLLRELPPIRALLDAKKVFAVSIWKHTFSDLPMHPNTQVTGCERVFVGGFRYGTGVAVVRALIEATDSGHDPTKVVKVNHCHPHFDVAVDSEQMYYLVREALMRIYTLMPPDVNNNNWERDGYWHVKFFLSSYETAVKVPRQIDEELAEMLKCKVDFRNRPNRSLPSYPWVTKKKTGGLQLVMLPQHAQRLLSMSQLAIQDTDNTILLASSYEAANAMHDCVKANTTPDMARLMCTPLRYISVEKRNDRGP